MNKVIRIIVAGLSLCGALALVPGIAEARENNPPVPAHVEHQGARQHARERREVRRDVREYRAHLRGRGERGRIEHERVCHVARERGDGLRRLEQLGCSVR